MIDRVGLMVRCGPAEKIEKALTLRCGARLQAHQGAGYENNELEHRPLMP